MKPNRGSLTKINENSVYICDVARITRDSMLLADYRQTGSFVETGRNVRIADNTCRTPQNWVSLPYNRMIGIFEDTQISAWFFGGVGGIGLGVRGSAVRI